MQVTETISDGLRREFKVVIPAAELDSKVSERLDDVTVLQLRHMLGAGEFRHAVQSIGRHGDEAKDMGEYFPRGRYLTASAFETAVPCLIERR